jgi:hypothetical protein
VPRGLSRARPFPNSSGSRAMLRAMRLASSRVSTLACRASASLSRDTRKPTAARWRPGPRSRPASSRHARASGNGGVILPWPHYPPSRAAIKGRAGASSRGPWARSDRGSGSPTAETRRRRWQTCGCVSERYIRVHRMTAKTEILLAPSCGFSVGEVRSNLDQFIADRLPDCHRRAIDNLLFLLFSGIDQFCTDRESTETLPREVSPGRPPSCPPLEFMSSMRGDPLSVPPASSSAKTTRMLSGWSNLRPTDMTSRLWRALASSLGYIAAAEDRIWTGVSVAARPCTRVRSTGLLDPSNRRIVAAVTLEWLNVWRR